MPFCPNCGNDVDEGQNYCVECGEKIPGSENESTAEKTSDTSPEATREGSSSEQRSLGSRIPHKRITQISALAVLLAIIVFAAPIAADILKPTLEDSHLRVSDITWIEAERVSADNFDYYGRMQVTLTAAEDTPRPFTVKYTHGSDYYGFDEFSKEIQLSPGESKTVTLKATTRNLYFDMADGEGNFVENKLVKDIPTPPSNVIKSSLDAGNLDIYKTHFYEYPGGEPAHYTISGPNQQDQYLLTLQTPPRSISQRYLRPTAQLQFKTHKPASSIEASTDCQIDGRQVSYESENDRWKTYSFPGANANALRTSFSSTSGVEDTVEFEAHENQGTRILSTQSGDLANFELSFYVTPDSISQYDYFQCSVQLSSAEGYTAQRDVKIRIQSGS